MGEALQIEDRDLYGRLSKILTGCLSTTGRGGCAGGRRLRVTNLSKIYHHNSHRPNSTILNIYLCTGKYSDYRL